MKKFILSAAFLAFAGLATQANELKLSNPLAVVQDSTTKTPVKLEELPEAVKATLTSEAYKAWTPIDAYLVKETSGKEFYAINVKKGEETGSIRLSADGKPVE